MADPRFWTIDETIARAMGRFRAKRGRRTIWAGNRRMETRTPGQRILHLPNGHRVNVTVDDSGVATQIDDGGSLHAIARPKPIVMRLRPESADAVKRSNHVSARPLPIRAGLLLPRRVLRRNPPTPTGGDR